MAFFAIDYISSKMVLVFMQGKKQQDIYWSIRLDTLAFSGKGYIVERYSQDLIPTRWAEKYEN